MINKNYIIIILDYLIIFIIFLYTINVNLHKQLSNPPDDYDIYYNNNYYVYSISTALSKYVYDLEVDIKKEQYIYIYNIFEIKLLHI